MIARLELAAVKTRSIVNIWRTIARVMLPSAIAITPAMQTIDSAPAASVATYSASQVCGSIVGAGSASARTITNATQTASASCARLKKSLIGGSRRNAYAAPAPSSAPIRKPSPLANASPNTNGKSASENECALRRK